MRDVQSARVCVLRLTGEYDLTRKNEIAELFATVDGESSVQIDLSEVTYIDSTILRELAMLRQRQNGHPIKLVGASSQIERVLRIVDFDKLFDIVG
jgi:anti-anti-sigma factor